MILKCPIAKDSRETFGRHGPKSQSEDNIVAARPYNPLLQSLVTSNKSNQRNPKYRYRKLDHTQNEEDGIILEEGEDLANEPEEDYYYYYISLSL